MDDNLRGLGEKEAEEVLDFLARKVGYDKLMFDESCIVLASKERRKKERRKVSSLHIYSGAYVDHMIASFKTYSDILGNMLKMSGSGLEILTSDNLVFLHADASLEKILVEMDLGYGNEVAIGK